MEYQQTQSNVDKCVGIKEHGSLGEADFLQGQVGQGLAGSPKDPRQHTAPKPKRMGPKVHEGRQAEEVHHHHAQPHKGHELKPFGRGETHRNHITADAEKSRKCVKVAWFHFNLS